MFSGRKVLVVDDNAINRTVIIAMLELLGVESTVARDGAEAIAYIKQSAVLPDAILMDCEMPNIDGYQATREIRNFEAMSKASRRPIIALSAHAFPEHQQRSLDAGMDDHLNKPISLARLVEVLKRHIEITEG